MTQSQLAGEVGVDCSTKSQLINGQGARLPNAQVVAECVAALSVSSDWLLCFSERLENAANLLADSFSLEHAPRALFDEQIFQWHQEAVGYKIRHVPATLPDMLKTDAMLEWEYGPHLGRTAEQAIGASRDRLNLTQASTSDHEIALPLHEMESFAASAGYCKGLPDEIRVQQIDYLSQLCSQMYPRLRLYMFDARRIYSAPVTIFGPLLAVLYIGLNYLAFRDNARIHTFTNRFDQLVREVSVNTLAIQEYIKALK